MLTMVRSGQRFRLPFQLEESADLLTEVGLARQIVKVVFVP